jgi:hypothetical protein
MKTVVFAEVPAVQGQTFAEVFSSEPMQHPSEVVHKS